jgi:RNA polymerase sigma-70 factor (ECF subfamily)
VYGICRRLAGNEADALDATQEALLAIVRGIARFDGRSSFGTWAHRVATNACLDELRRRGRRPIPGLPTTDPPSSGPSLDTNVAARLDLDAALGRLSEEFRMPLVLRDVVGLDYAEIATVLGIPGGTVRSRIARARAALARDLGGNQDMTAERQNESE